MEMQEIVVIVSAFAGMLVGTFFAVRSTLKEIGEKLEGEDWAERAVAKMDESVTPVFEGLKDLLNPDTHGGVGRGPDNEA